MYHLTQCNYTKKESMTYSGERQLLSIATMHKSNLVPVFKEDKNYAKDLAINEEKLEKWINLTTLCMKDDLNDTT